MPTGRVFSLAEAADYIGVATCAPNTALTEKLALIPPRFERVGRRGIIVFLREDLDAWKRVTGIRRRRNARPLDITTLPPHVLSTAPLAGIEGAVAHG